MALAHAGRHAIVSLPEQEARAVFLEAYTRRSLCEELSSASVNSRLKTVRLPHPRPRRHFDLFFSGSVVFASAATQHF